MCIDLNGIIHKEMVIHVLAYTIAITLKTLNHICDIHLCIFMSDFNIYSFTKTIQNSTKTKKKGLRVYSAFDFDMLHCNILVGFIEP